jgi:glycosyltransferase EpsJ
MEGISVIIPIHNTEKYLRKALNSCNEQEFDTVEYILVDDGSTDNSGKICDEYAQRNLKFTAYHIENGGVAAARNYGIQKAKFNYLYFLDSDDYIEKDMLQKLYHAMESSGSSMAICGYYMETHNENQKVLHKYSYKLPEKEVYHNEIFIRDNCWKLWENSLLYNVWNKLFLKEIIVLNNITYPLMTMGEDLAFLCAYLQHCKSIVVIPDCLYHYIRLQRVAATSRYIENWFAIRMEEHQRLTTFFYNSGLYNAWGREFLNRRFTERVLGCIENECQKANPKSAREKKRQINEILAAEEVTKAIQNMNPMSLKVKLMLVPIKMKSVGLTCLMGGFISMVRYKMPGLFMALKTSR